MGEVFLVDDHEDTLEMLSVSLLKNARVNARSFQNFESAYLSLSQDHPCIALIDLHVPGKMTASEFISKTREQFPNLPVVLVSGDPKAKEVAARERVGFMLKPFSLDDVEKMVKDCCFTTL